MKVCPTCNNMSENNVSICPYCGRNIIGVNENYHDLKIQNQARDEFRMNSSTNNTEFVNKIYGHANTKKDKYKLVEVKTRFSKKYSKSFNKNIALFISLFFLISISSSISRYKSIISNSNILIIFLIPVIYSVIIFLSISLKFSTRVKMAIIILLSFTFLAAYGYYTSIIQFDVLDLFFRIENISVISISLLAIIISHRYIKSLILTFLLLFISYKYYLHLKTFKFELIDILLIIKPLFLSLSIALLLLFLIYEFIFLHYETERVVNRN